MAGLGTTSMADHFQRYDAYIIDSDLDSRMRLKQATTSVVNFAQVWQAGKLKECLDRISSGQKVDVIFISYRFDANETTAFINQAKNIPATQDAAFVMLLRQKDKESAAVATTVLNGADGLLFEPFSVDQLTEITALAAKVRKERSGAREEAALRFLLSDIINQIDQIAYLKGCSFETGPSVKKLKEMCTVFQTLSDESKLLYMKLAVDTFEAAPLPKLIYQRKKYSGVSSRVQKRMEQKTLASLGADEETTSTKE